jgi:hypothetical protein
MRMRVDSLLVCTALVGAGAACGGATEPLPVCSGAVSIAVSTGTEPTIDWTPACGVERLIVTQPLAPSLGPGVAEQWAIRADGRLIEPPVRYGRAPRGTAVDVTAGPLETGTEYGVAVWISDGQLGFTRFTP